MKELNELDTLKRNFPTHIKKAKLEELDTFPTKREIRQIRGPKKEGIFLQSKRVKLEELDSFLQKGRNCMNYTTIKRELKPHYKPRKKHPESVFSPFIRIQEQYL